MEGHLIELEEGSCHASGSSYKNEMDFSGETEEEDERDDDEEEVAVDYEERDRELANKLQNEEMNYRGGRKSERLQSKSTFCLKKHESAIVKSLAVILKKPYESLTNEERSKLLEYPELAKEAEKRLERRLTAIDRLREFEDPQDQLQSKCSALAAIIENANYLVVYTGAGISTSADIPDYRGPNGIWTLLQKGQSLDSEKQVLLTTADPTPTHMALYQLYKRGMIKHIVSQNCDGLHLRSGVPKKALSEVHGNMYIEVCVKCNREYVRTFDVTENTRRREHRTGRNCYHCGSQLKDTVVHFGERGSLRWPLNWAGAEYNASHADVILCLGSSLKVLRRYPWLWCMDKPANKRPTLCIVNLQWTPKDQFSRLKIHGKCDTVMSEVMSILGLPIPPYERHKDPLFRIATHLHASEAHSKTTSDLAYPPDSSPPPKSSDLDNYIRFEPVKTAQVLADAHPDASVPKRGNGTGWLGNAWGVKPKNRKKIKRMTQNTEDV